MRWWAMDGPENNRSAIVPNPLDRQWPCPPCYHVPTAGEWWLLLRYWKDSAMPDVPLYGNNGLYFVEDAWARAGFMSYFNLSYGGSLYYSDAKLYSQWELGYYWSSSPAGPVSTNNYARRLTLTSAGAYTNDSYYRARAFRVRCFANPHCP